MTHKHNKIKSDLEKEIKTMDAILERKDETTESILEDYEFDKKKYINMQERGWKIFWDNLSKKVDETFKEFPH